MGFWCCDRKHDADRYRQIFNTDKGYASPRLIAGASSPLFILLLLEVTVVGGTSCLHRAIVSA
jgi:hypothetical protein